MGVTLQNDFSYTRGYLTKLTHNNFNFGFAFDALGREKSVDIDGQMLFTRTYDTNSVGGRETTTYASGEESVLYYDIFGNPTERIYKSSAGNKTLFTAKYDESGNLTQKKLFRQRTIDIRRILLYNLNGIFEMRRWRMKLVKKCAKILLGVLAAILLSVIIYLLYVILSYSRIPDNLELEIDNAAEADVVLLEKEYTVVTQNLGFGAYTADFTFFMDGGKESRAESRESVISCVEQGANKVKTLSPDFILFQEVDLDSTRSYHTDQYELLREHFPDYSSTYAQNYDSAFLMYPIFDPHGASKSSIATFSNVAIASSLRRSFPISTSFSKFLDLDRCYSVTRIPVENGKELLLYNVHSSAYGGSDEIRSAQMTMLMEDISSEYEKGNYVVCGGDFNHDFTGDSSEKINGYFDDQGWAQPFPEELIPEGFSRCISYKDGEILPTCRNCDIPYEDGNYTIIVDGFIVSDNVECVTVENVQTGFEYSDHAPVSMTFKLT